MTQPLESSIFMPSRRFPIARIHAIPAPKSSIDRFVDAIDLPVALVDRQGVVATMNGAARDFFLGRTGLALREAVEAHARAVMGSRRKTGDGMPNRPHAIDIGQDRFLATVVAAGSDLATQDVGAMVLLKRERSGVQAGPLLTEHGLTKRFGLTAQEARVALMLADQRSNRDIADRLGVSVHTARHHTERVLAKLHIHSRHDVKRVIG